jgi:hypothetical protein
LKKPMPLVNVNPDNTAALVSFDEKVATAPALWPSMVVTLGAAGTGDCNQLTVEVDVFDVRARRHFDSVTVGRRVDPGLDGRCVTGNVDDFGPALRLTRKRQDN